jgi:hypothetical protein
MGKADQGERRLGGVTPVESVQFERAVAGGGRRPLRFSAWN